MADLQIYRIPEEDFLRDFTLPYPVSHTMVAGKEDKDADEVVIRVPLQ
jgi:hypothetical protein